MIGINFDLILGMIIEAAGIIAEEIARALSWWQWVLFFIGIAVNVWVADESKKIAFQRERDHQEMLSTLHAIENQIKVIKNTEKTRKEEYDKTRKTLKKGMKG